MGQDGILRADWQSAHPHGYFTFTPLESSSLTWRTRPVVLPSGPRKKLTSITKSNAQVHTLGLWDEVYLDVAKQ